MKDCCEVAEMFGQACLDCNPVKRAKTPRVENPCAKTVKRENAYEVWRNDAADWTWYVLKKWQVDDDAPYARWFCCVTSPMTGPSGDYGDVYVKEIKANARRVK